MKIVTVVGARPQFIKAAALSRALRREHTEVLVHTGQHYDPNMSQVFFDELDIPAPDYNLGIAGGSHGQMTGRMLMVLEETLQKERPEMLLLFGDTNSTLAGALAAVKLRIPVAHVEAGNRTKCLDNPEEVNRVCTDHISALRFACVESSMAFLRQEGLESGSYLVGDPMYDAFMYYSARLERQPIQTLPGFVGKVAIPGRFYYLTCHREENTRDEKALEEILSAMEALDAPVLYPLHPRNRETALALRERKGLTNTLMVPAVGYLESIFLISHAQKVITDSGGVQREAFFAQRPCVTVMNLLAWPETMVGNCNQLAEADREDILAKLAVTPQRPAGYQPFGDGHAAEKICAHLKQWEAEHR